MKKEPLLLIHECLSAIIGLYAIIQEQLTTTSHHSAIKNIAQSAVMDLNKIMDLNEETMRQAVGFELVEMISNFHKRLTFIHGHFNIWTPTTQALSLLTLCEQRFLKILKTLKNRQPMESEGKLNILLGNGEIRIKQLATIRDAIIQEQKQINEQYVEPVML